MKFEISKRARRQIEKISRWWIENRPAAPSMFDDELAEAARLLRQNPEAGPAYATHRTGVVRRVLLAGTKHHLYYRYRSDRDEMIVLTVGVHLENAHRNSELETVKGKLRIRGGDQIDLV